ncbi:MAG: serine/threonine protein kinase [Solobacterium sp.]|nr:serine/threonine protein kinase [Solobacterium sp.]
MALKEVWPGYETIERIGKGSYGAVYKVMKKDASGEYFSAVKKISIPSSEEEVDVLQDDGYDRESITALFAERMGKIVEEFKLMEKFKGNSHIVSYEDHMIVQHENDPGWDILIRMELLTSLPKYYTHLNEEEVIHLGIDICDALELIQKENIVHRDIKPQNIMVNSYGAYKLGDFGIAKTMDHATKATQIGTPDYIAPEVFHKKAYGFQADQYSLGLVMYWALNNRKMPFVPTGKKAPTYEEIETAKQRRMNGEPVPEPLKGSEALKKAVLKACSYDPNDRFPTITDFKKALEKALYNHEAEEIIEAEVIDENDFDENEETIGAWGNWDKTSVEQSDERETPSYVSGNTVQAILASYLPVISQSSQDPSLQYTVGPDFDEKIVNDAKKILKWNPKYPIVGCLVYYSDSIPVHAFIFGVGSVSTNMMKSGKDVMYYECAQVIAYPNRITVKREHNNKVIYLTKQDNTPICSGDLLKDLLEALYEQDKSPLKIRIDSSQKKHTVLINEEDFDENEETMGAWGSRSTVPVEQPEIIEDSFQDETIEPDPVPIVNQLSGNPIQNILASHFPQICQSSSDHSMRYTVGPDPDEKIIDDAKRVLQWKLKYKIEGCLVYYTNNIPSHAFLFTNTSIYTNTMTSRKMLYYRDGEKMKAYSNRVTLKQGNKNKVLYLTAPDNTVMCSSELFKNMLQELYYEDHKKLEKILGSAHKTNSLDIDKESIVKNYLMRLSSAAPLGLTSYTYQKPIISQTQTKSAFSLLRIHSTRSGIIGCILPTHKSLTPWKHTLLFTQNEFYSNMFTAYGRNYIEYKKIVKIDIVRKDNKTELQITTVNTPNGRKTVSVLNLVENVSLFGKTTVIYSPEILKEMLEKLSGIA